MIHIITQSINLINKKQNVAPHHPALKRASGSKGFAIDLNTCHSIRHTIRLKINFNIILNYTS